MEKILDSTNVLLLPKHAVSLKGIRIFNDSENYKVLTFFPSTQNFSITDIYTEFHG